MYYYIYDNYLAEKKYQGTLSKIESQLTDLGINGKIVKMSVLKNLHSQAAADIANGVKTIIIVGNDQTFNQAINLVNNFSLPFGIIPIGPNNKIAELMGIPEGEPACNIISSRNIQQINLGIINQQYYFVTYLEMPGDGAYINCDDNYFINIEDKKDIVTISSIYYGEYEHKIKIKNNANFLNLIIKNKTGGFFAAKKDNFSCFKAKKITVTGEKSIPIILIDEKKIIKTPIKAEISKQKLRLIAGKNRKI